MSELITIGITGPESTGKSALSQRLAHIYGAEWAPEFARAYLDLKGPSYTEDDLRAIAEGQLAVSRVARERASDYVFYDTDLLTIEVWSQFVFGHVDPWIREKSMRSDVDLYLLCDIDLPWEPDPLREHPDQREELFQIYHDHLVSRGKPFRVVRGSGEDRLKSAMKALEEMGHSPRSRSSS